MAPKADQKRANAWTRAQVRAKAEETVGDTTHVLYYSDTNPELFVEWNHQFFRTPEERERLKDVDQSNDDAVVRALLGDEQFETFQANGGDSGDVSMMMAFENRRTQEAMENGRPTTR